MPAWIHASSPFAPWPGPPTPTQPATCPASTLGARVIVIVARTPCPRYVGLVAGVRVAARLDVADAGTSGRRLRGGADERGDASARRRGLRGGAALARVCRRRSRSARTHPSFLRSGPVGACASLVGRRPPTMRRDGDDRGPRRGRVARRLARERLRPRAGAHRRALLDDLGDRERAALRRRRTSTSTTRATSATRASIRSRAASIRRCTAAGSGRCASSPASAPPEETNERFRYLLEHGQTGLSTAFDMPTLMGYDSDHAALARRGRARGRRGRLARRHGDALRAASRSATSRPR